MPVLPRDRRYIAAAVVAVAALGYWLARPPAVEVVAVAPQAIRETLQLTGRIATRDRANLAAQVAGTVARVAVEEGDAVRAGQLLVAIDNPELAAALHQAEASLAQAVARQQRLRDIEAPTAQAEAERAAIEREQAARQLDNLLALEPSGAVGTEQVRAARETLALKEKSAQTAQLRARSLAGGRDRELGEADVAQARAAAAVARARLAWTQVRAPADGVVVGRDIDPGAAVQPGTALLAFAPRASREVRVNADERFLSMLREGQPVGVVADAYPAEPFRGTIARLSPRVDAARGALDVRIALPEPPAWLREDMTVSVEILVGENAQAPVLPLSAIHDAAAGAWAWCLDEGRVRRCNLRLGLRDAQRAQVLDGAPPGTWVVNDGRTLADGDRVRPVTGSD